MWACPLRQRSADVTWDLYSLDPSKLYVNLGFWSSVPLQLDEMEGTYNWRIEEKVERARRPEIPLQHGFLRGGSLLGALRWLGLRAAEEDL